MCRTHAASDNNQLQQQPCGIDHDLYMVFTGDVIIVFSSNSNFMNNPIWPPVGWYNNYGVAGKGLIV